MDIAIYGGTFDPPTRAHEYIAEALSDSGLFDEVWIMPSADRVDKPEMAPAIHREAMVRAMIANLQNSRIRFSNFEIDLGEPTQTVRTYAALKAAHPNISFWFVFGADSYNDMPSWEGGDALQKTLPMCVIPRFGHATPQDTANVHVLPVPQATELEVSSTIVRQLARYNGDINGYVSDNVKSYVLQHALYT